MNDDLNDRVKANYNFALSQSTNQTPCSIVNHAISVSPDFSSFHPFPSFPIFHIQRNELRQRLFRFEHRASQKKWTD